MLTSRFTRTGAMLLVVANLVCGSAFAQATAQDDTEAIRIKVPIRWRTDLEQAYADALRQNKPFVIFFTHNHNDGRHTSGEECFAAKQERELASSQFGIGGDEAVFVVVYLNSEAGPTLGNQLAEKLEVPMTPAIRVLWPNTQQLVVCGGTNGVLVHRVLSSHAFMQLRTMLAPRFSARRSLTS